MLFLRLSAVVFALCATPLMSHEFWIEPEDYQVETGDTISAHLRNGENFKGVSLAWFENRFTRFEMVQGNQVKSVEGRMGDTPALQTTAPDQGLMVIVHETTPSTLTYKEWDKFLRFVEHKDFKTAVADHEARGWSKETFRESYTRHAKALVAVETANGSDRELGLKTEFVALTNPYAPEFNGTMTVRLLYDGMPRPDAQVEVFEKSAAGDVTITLYRTDQKGEAIIPVQPGHAYLFDAVVLRPSDQAGTSERAPVWETYWAALTFQVPD